MQDVERIGRDIEGGKEGRGNGGVTEKDLEDIFSYIYWRCERERNTEKSW